MSVHPDDVVGLDFYVWTDDILTIEVRTKHFLPANVERVRAEFHARIDEAFAHFAAAHEAGVLNNDLFKAHARGEPS